MNDEPQPILLLLADDPGDPWLKALERLSERFWRLVDVRGPDECWEWLGGMSNGYGKFSLYPSGVIQATHVALAFAGRPILEGQWALHTCPGGDNSRCCNPAHLRPGTPRDNSRDMVERGRHGSVRVRKLNRRVRPSEASDQTNE